MKNFDQENHVRRESSKHKGREDSDIFTVVDIVKEIKAFNEVPGRTHPYIGSIPKDPISVLSREIKMKVSLACRTLMNEPGKYGDAKVVV